MSSDGQEEKAQLTHKDNRRASRLQTAALRERAISMSSRGSSDGRIAVQLGVNKSQVEKWLDAESERIAKRGASDRDRDHAVLDQRQERLLETIYGLIQDTNDVKPASTVLGQFAETARLLLRDMAERKGLHSIRIQNVGEKSAPSPQGSLEVILGEHREFRVLKARRIEDFDVTIPSVLDQQGDGGGHRIEALPDHTLSTDLG